MQKVWKQQKVLDLQPNYKYSVTSDDSWIYEVNNLSGNGVTN